MRFVGGPKHIDCHVYTCRNPKCPLEGVARKPEALSMSALDGYEVGLDVIAHIGHYRLKTGMSYPKIRTCLCDIHKVRVSERRVEDLGNLYVALRTYGVRTRPEVMERLIWMPVTSLGCVAGPRYGAIRRSAVGRPCRSVPRPGRSGRPHRASSGAWPASAALRLRRFVRLRAAPNGPLRRGDALPQGCRVVRSPVAGAHVTAGPKELERRTGSGDFTHDPGGARL